MTDVDTLGTTGSILTTKREKDPRRVEAGKRLAAISRQAKERKRVRELQSVGTIVPSDSKKYMVGLTMVGVVVAIATLWYTMYPRRPPKKTEHHVEEEPPEENLRSTSSLESL